MTQIDYDRHEGQRKFREIYGTGRGINQKAAESVAFMDSGLKTTPKGAEYVIEMDPVGGFIATFRIKRES
jgi:hypothetical protein